MKAFYIVSIIVGLIFGYIVVHFSLEEEVFRNEMYSQWEYVGDIGSGYEDLREMSFKSTLISLPFIAFFIFLFSVSLSSKKHITPKVLSIIGVCSSGIVFLISLLPIFDRGKISFEELSYLLIPYILVVEVICLINFIRFNRADTSDLNQNTVDDIL